MDVLLRIPVTSSKLPRLNCLATIACDANQAFSVRPLGCDIDSKSSLKFGLLTLVITRPTDWTNVGCSETSIIGVLLSLTRQTRNERMTFTTGLGQWRRES